MDVCVFIEGHFTWKIGSLVTAGKVRNSLVTAGGLPGYGRKQCLGIVVKLPCSVAVTDRATGVRRCLGDWTSRDIYLKSYHSDLAAIYLDYFYDYSLQDRCPYLLGYL